MVQHNKALVFTGHLLRWHDTDANHCLNTQNMRSCAVLPPRVGYPPGGWGSSFLSQPGEWWEPSTGQPKRRCYFYHTVLNLRAAPRRPVASSLPQAAEFNPRTALPRGDGKHLASCFDYKASLSSLSASWATRGFSVMAKPFSIVLIALHKYTIEEEDVLIAEYACKLEVLFGTFPLMANSSWYFWVQYCNTLRFKGPILCIIHVSSVS